jgi:hypothetical protein
VVSVTGCYEQLPDPEVLAQCLRDSFQEYLALAQRALRRSAPAAKVVHAAVPAKPKRTRVRRKAGPAKEAGAAI